VERELDPRDIQLLKSMAVLGDLGRQAFGAERDARRRAYRRRRAIAVAIVALPVAVLAAAMAWPSGGAGSTQRHAAFLSIVLGAARLSASGA